MTKSPPNDPIFNALNVEAAWELVSPGKLQDVKVAYIDTGFEPGRLQGRHIPVTTVCVDDSGVDTDIIGHGTLFASILHRYTYINNTGKGSGPLGPHITAIKAGDTENLPVKHVIRGIRKALELGVDVLSVNVCNVYYNAEMADLLHQAARQGVIAVAPAGNFIRGEYTFPASLDTVIASTSVTIQKEIPGYVNAFSRVDVGAPEEDVKYHIPKEILDRIMAMVANIPEEQQPTPQGMKSKNPFAGTSFSLPLVVAAAALIKAIQPEAGVHDVREILKHGLSEKITMEPGTSFGFLDFRQAVAKAAAMESPAPSVDFSYEPRLYFQLQHRHDRHSLGVAVCDFKGEPGEQPGEQAGEEVNSAVELRVFPFSPLRTTENNNLIEAQTVSLQNGQLEWSYDHLPEGSYFVRLIDPAGAVTPALGMIKR